MVTNFDLTHDFDLQFPGLHVKFVIFIEKMGWLAWNKYIDFDLSYDHDLEFSKLATQSAISQDLDFSQVMSLQMLAHYRLT